MFLNFFISRVTIMKIYNNNKKSRSVHVNLPIYIYTYTIDPHKNGIQNRLRVLHNERQWSRTI